MFKHVLPKEAVREEVTREMYETSKKGCESGDVGYGGFNEVTVLLGNGVGEAEEVVAGGGVKVVIFIELYGEGTGSGRCPKGDSSLSKIGALKPHLAAICHNVSGGSVVSTMFRVEDKWVDRSDIDTLLNAHPKHKEYGSLIDTELRGLEMCSGTPTRRETNDLNTRLQNRLGMDLNNYEESSSGKSWLRYLKNEVTRIGQGKWLCNHADHGEAEKVSIQNNICSYGHSKANQYATIHQNPFDITSWL